MKCVELNGNTNMNDNIPESYQELHNINYGNEEVDNLIPDSDEEDEDR